MVAKILISVMGWNTDGRAVLDYKNIYIYMITYKTKDGYIARFILKNVVVNVIANTRLDAIRMALDYISNV